MFQVLVESWKYNSLVSFHSNEQKMQEMKGNVLLNNYAIIHEQGKPVRGLKHSAIESVVLGSGKVAQSV